ncbi:MAG: HlyC/CorC family transporter [Phycisphaerae bacterium]|nr:HlyC/CorC family transporter [Phycisphaerae bacterium]
MNGSAWLWTGLLSAGVGGLLATIFHSLKDMTRTRLAELAEERAAKTGSGAGRRRVERILEDVDGHLTAVALPRIVCNMVTAVAAVFWVASFTSHPTPTGLQVLIGIVAASLLVWVVGLVIPQSVAGYAAERTVYAWSWLIRVCYAMQAPLNAVVSFLDEAIRRLAGRSDETEAEQREAEIMSAVDEAQQEGQVDQVERDMIQAVVEFSQTTVRQIMTPRTEIEALALTNNLGEVVRFIRTCRHSRIPVYDGTLDSIVGMFYIKDLMRWMAGDVPRASGKGFELRSILRPAYFVPESKTIRELLQEFVDKKVHVAMVADEFGGTSGLVTLEDIIEEIVGEIQDEYEAPEDDAPVIVVDGAARTADLDARAYISDANDRLRALGVELPESDEYDTIAGLVSTLLRRIPEAGEVVELPGLIVRVVEAEPTRATRVRVEVAASEPEPEAKPLEATPEA